MHLQVQGLHCAFETYGVLVRPLKFPIHPGSGSTVCYRFLKVLVIGGEKGFLFYPLIGQVSGDYKQIFPQVTTGS